MASTPRIHGTPLHIEVRGHGSPVLVIAAAPGDAGHHAAVAELLASDHTVITYDRRGSSRSPASGPTSLDQHADDAGALLRHLGAAPATVFGTGSGAIIALRLALRTPDVVKRLILHEPPFVGAVPDAAVVADASDELAIAGSWLPGKDELTGLRMPVRVLGGEDHRGAPRHRAAAWLAQGLGTDLLEFPGTHALHLSHARDVVAALRPLLDDEPRQMRVSVRGRGAPLVLVGGGLTGMASWEPHQALLADRRKVVRAQLLSVQYGLDGRPLPEGYSVTAEGDALGRALDDLGFTDPVDLVAWSYGAESTLDYALRHPARFRTLTLIEPPAFWVLDATGTMDERSRRESADMHALYDSMPGPDVTADQLASFAHQAGFVPPDTAPTSTPMWPSWLKHRRSLLTGDAAWRATGTRAALAAITAPVLLVKGTGSRHMFHRIIDGLASALPRARVIELPGGHAPQLAARDRFLAELAALTGS